MLHDASLVNTQAEEACPVCSDKLAEAHQAAIANTGSSVLGTTVFTIATRPVEDGAALTAWSFLPCPGSCHLKPCRVCVGIWICLTGRV